MAGKLAAVNTKEMGPEPTDGARDTIAFEEPYSATVTLKGTAPLLFHRYNVEAVAEQANAVKGSRKKKQDNVESFVFRNEDGILCMPGLYLRSALIDTARFRQDPRSPRKSARDLYKAALIALTELAPIGPMPTRDWPYQWVGRHVVQRNAVSRTLPGFPTGWEVRIELAVTLPEYVRPEMLHELIVLAGRINGVSEMRPTYGRFQVTNFKVSAVS